MSEYRAAHPPAAPDPAVRDLDWAVDGPTWPNHEASRFVTAGGLRWHAQVMGGGPPLLLIHGTGASTHSWRALLPLLATRFTVIAPDLPGHGFTELPREAAGLSLPGMAGGVAALLGGLGLQPAYAIGHSAGAAVLARMSLDGGLPGLRELMSLNGALLPLNGFAAGLFSPIARLVASTSLAARLFARHSTTPGVVERMLRDTGSSLDPEGVDLYARLAHSPHQVGAALGMMANWDLDPLERELPRLQPHLLLVVGTRDRTISPAQALRVRRLVPGATIERLADLGHLAHEERPEAVARLAIERARDVGALPP